MLRRFSPNVAIIAMLIDFLAVFAGMELSYLLHSKLPQFSLAAYLAFPLIWWAIFAIGALYDGRRNLRIVDELVAFTGLCLLAVVSLAGIIYLHDLEIPRAQFITFGLTTVSLQLSAHLGLRAFWRFNKQYGNGNGNGNGNGKRKVLIVGAGELGRKVKSEINEIAAEANMELVGFVDDHPQKLANPEVLGRVDQTAALAKRHQVSDVVITLPASAHKLREELVADLNKASVHVWVVPDIFRLALHQPKIELFAGMPMLDVRAPAINEHQRLVKRIFDLLATSLILLLIWPIMLLIAILIRRDSRGPIIFRQVRVGENGQLFKMYKFRTMVENAESLRHLVEQRDENGNLLHKSPTDPRVTRFGWFLRRTSLDELPQFFNVLKGEMSLVGPRPELPYLVEQYEPWQHARFSVPPGITGWWQINGRSDKPMHLNTEDDIYYVQNCSLWLDIQILLKTVLVVLLRRGAY